MDRVNHLFPELSLEATSMSGQEEPQSAPSSVVDIADTGDVILVVGPEKIKLRVQSLILKATSKPFAAMLGPNWMQSREQPSPEHPMEILLPDDNAISLKYICAVIHSRTQMIPEDPSPQDVYDIAIVAEKYFLIDCLALVSRLWLRARKQEAAADMLLLASAWIFHNAEAFKENAKSLILNYAGSYLALYTEQIEALVDWRVVYWLEEKRNSARLQLGDILFQTGHEGCHGNSCEWVGKYAFAQRSLKALKFGCIQYFPENPASINAVATIAKFHDQESDSLCRNTILHRMPAHGSIRRDKLKRFDEEIGLCLDCIRLNNPSPGNCNTAAH